MSGGPALSSPPPGDSAVKRLAGIFFWPVRTFEAIARRPGWVAPLLLWTLVSGAGGFALAPRLDFSRATREQMEKSGQPVTEEKLSTMVRVQQTSVRVLGVLGPTLLSVIVALVLLGAVKAFGWDLSWRQSFAVTVHANLPRVVQALLLFPVAASREKIAPESIGDLVRSNPGFLVDPGDSPVLHQLLQSFDLFSLWVLGLTIVGFAAAARVPRARVAALVVPLWLLFILGAAGCAALRP